LPLVYGQRVFGCQVLGERDYGRPGRLLRETEDSFLVSTVDYNVEIFKDKLSQLIQCCRIGDVEGMRGYLRNAALINEQADNGKTPLIIAVEAGKLEAVKYLREAGSRIDIACHDGKRPRDYADEFPEGRLRRDLRIALRS
jgi:methionyl-tRNA formyltransferase